MSRVSIHQQIDEVDRELKMRAQVYPSWVARGKLRQSIADYQVRRLEAVMATLEWVRDNEIELRAYVEKKKGAAA